ncbi:MAG: alpha/beta hydrolase [Planctomycetota bacterium]
MSARWFCASLSCEPNWLRRQSILLTSVVVSALVVCMAGCGGGERAAAPPSTELQSADETEVSPSNADASSASRDWETGSELQPKSPSTEPGVDSRSRRIPILDGPSIPTSQKPHKSELTLSPELNPKSQHQPSVRLPNTELQVRASKSGSAEFPSMEGFAFGGEALASDEPLEFAESPTEADSAESAEELLAGPSPERAQEQAYVKTAETVEVFFATDRRLTEEVLPSMLRTFLPALAVGAICSALVIGLSMARRFQLAWIMGTALAACLGVTVLHVSIIRWQEYSRLAAGNSTRFSTLRYHPDERNYPLHLGVASISIPHSHQKGVIETPKIARFEFKESPDKHIMLQRVEVLESSDDWFEQLSSSAPSQAEQDGFVFIHGYNVRFGDALKRTAQLATDLEVSGPIISYSWPSRGQLAAYPADEASVEWAGPNLERLLADLASKTDIRRFNVVAHSMGNRALLDSIERLHLRTSHQRQAESDSNSKDDVNAESTSRIGALVLAAPDVDANLFTSRYQEPMEQVAERTVLYFTQDDWALQVSSKLHSTPRLGLGSLDPRGVDA